MSAQPSDPLKATGAQPACLSVHEPDRLAALHRLKLLDAPKSASFDRVTRQAARSLGVPIVLVSLVDQNRQWFMSRVGLEATETSRDVSFCAHAVYECRPLNVSDATLDPRFAGNPLVVGPPHIRAYLGIPLYTGDGFAIGTLCGIDRQPRRFSEDDVNMFRDFAYMIEELIHAQEQTSRLERSFHGEIAREKIFRDTFERAAAGIFIVGLDGRLLRANFRACELLGMSAEEISARSLEDITHAGDQAILQDQFARLAVGDRDIFHLQGRCVRKDGGQFPTKHSFALKRTPTGRPDYAIAVMQDLAEGAE